MHRQVDRLETALLLFVIPTGLILPLLYLFTPLLNFADYELPQAAKWCGTIVMLAGLWLFWRSHADLGRNWSVSLEVRKGHQLITSGVYRWILWLAGFSALVPFVVLYLLRTPREEQMMLQFFGDEYRDYMRRTGRLIPPLL